MIEQDHDAAHFSNGSKTQRFRDATQERAIYRRWVRGAITFYAVVFLAAGTLAWTGSANNGMMEITSQSAGSAAKPTGAN
ncbi:hypothetical protein [Bradyrhizobium lablabi]|uniref:hypothetical protein n=1 Tax=Bradyrhizobium lablabi TaxID=722472 RepID=UPI001BA4A50E|nr:hypothetical protein [Bradyrhizobium lablabi]MBR0695209.1 hypothetical protein [Bradyrhizobium lablabi]